MSYSVEVNQTNTAYIRLCFFFSNACDFLTIFLHIWINNTHKHNDLTNLKKGNIMRFYEYLIEKVANSEQLGVHLCRISIAIVFLWIDWLKFIPYEADSIVPFVANSPFMSWLYNDPANYLQYMNHEGA